MNWQQAELLGYAYYVEKGYRILVPIVRYDAYDFVAEKDGVFIRVNVKVAGLKDKSDPNSWAISQASGGLPGKTQKGTVDILLTWIQKRFIELPGDFFKDGNSKSKRIPKDFMDH